MSRQICQVLFSIFFKKNRAFRLFGSACDCGNNGRNHYEEENENDDTCIDEQGKAHEPPRPRDDTDQLENEENNEEDEENPARAERYIDFLIVHFFYFLSFFLYLV